MPSTVVTIPQARIPFGFVMVGGNELPVTISIDWMRAFDALIKRTGGIDGSTSFEQYVDQFYETPTVPAAQEALRAIDDIKNLLESARGDIQCLRNDIETLKTEPQNISVLETRLREIEDRLQ